MLLFALPALGCFYLLFATWRGLLRLPELRRVQPTLAEWPSINIITPACNEEKHVVSAISSMLAIDYPELSVTAVDDRSSDRTGALLDGIRDPRLRVVHVHELRDGWLGKLNALAVGTAQANAEWLLFMDADAHLGKLTLKRAISYAEAHGLDCVSVIPEVAPAGIVADAVFNVSLALMSAGDRLQKVRDPESPKVAATGAFILVRKAAFDRTPGFEWLRLEVADDFGLVLLIKSHGGRCAILNGRDEVKLEWYASFREMSHAMQKNFFAIMARFSLLRSLVLALLATWTALFVLTPRAFIVTLPAYACMSLATWLSARATGRPSASLLWPLGFLGIAWMSLRSGFIGKRLGGIAWRGVVYPSRMLAANQRVRM